MDIFVVAIGESTTDDDRILLVTVAVMNANARDGSPVDNEQRMIRLAVVDLSWNNLAHQIQVRSFPWTSFLIDQHVVYALMVVDNIGGSCHSGAYSHDAQPSPFQ